MEENIANKTDWKEYSWIHWLIDWSHIQLKLSYLIDWLIDRAKVHFQLAVLCWLIDWSIDWLADWRQQPTKILKEQIQTERTDPCTIIYYTTKNHPNYCQQSGWIIVTRHVKTNGFSDIIRGPHKIWTLRGHPAALAIAMHAYKFSPSLPGIFHHGSTNRNGLLRREQIHKIDVLGNRSYSLCSFTVHVEILCVTNHCEWGYEDSSRNLNVFNQWSIVALNWKKWSIFCRNRLHDVTVQLRWRHDTEFPPLITIDRLIDWLISNYQTFFWNLSAISFFVILFYCLRLTSASLSPSM